MRESQATTIANAIMRAKRDARCSDRAAVLKRAQCILYDEFGLGVSLNKLGKVMQRGRRRLSGNWAVDMFRDPEPLIEIPEPEPVHEPFTNAGAQTEQQAMADRVSFAVVNEDTGAVNDWHDKNPEREPKGYTIEDYKTKQKLVHGQNNHYHGFIPKGDQ